jgi:N-acetylglucosaminyl-diphospho-decaprenol L-rhamnosyltransferase
MRLCIIVINYKSENLTINFIKNELSKLTISFQIIIVNNEATESSDNFLLSKLDATRITNYASTHCNNLCNKRIFILSSKRNLGFAKGNNLAVEFVSKNLNSDFILFSNNDIHINETNVINILANKMLMNKKIGMVGPKIIGIDGKCQSPEPYQGIWKKYFLFFYFSRFFNSKYKSHFFDCDYSEKAKEGFHYRIMGSFFLVKLQDYIDCGMMDPKTFLYAEESILSERMMKIGKGAYYLPTVSVIHEHGKITNKSFKEKKRKMYQFHSDSYYYKKYRKINFLTIEIIRFFYWVYLNVKYF